MNGESGLFQIALELEAGSLDELLILGIVRDSRQLATDVGTTNPFQTDVYKAVGTGKQAGGFRRSVLAQKDEQGDGRCNQHNCEEDRKASSKTHGKANRFRAL